jgi:disulfide bond formation protein DsbB
MFSSLLPTILKHWVAQVLGLIGAMISSVWGLLIAIEHVDIQTAINPFFASCEIVPNFPSWAPLHEWLPQIFAATGDCGDIKWSFVGMSMPQWMIVIFAAYTCVLIFVAATALMKKKNQ